MEIKNKFVVGKDIIKKVSRVCPIFDSPKDIWGVVW